MRRNIKPFNIVEVKLSSLLNGYPINYNYNIHDTLEIIDDCDNIAIDDLSILNKYCSNYKIKNLKLIDISVEHHRKFLENFNQKNVNVSVKIKSPLISLIYREHDPSKEKLLNEVTDESITRISFLDRHKIRKNNINILSYHSEFLSNEKLLHCIDLLAYEINKYAKTDVEKIVLLNKIIKENIVYDFECLSDTERYLRNRQYIQNDSFNLDNENVHIGHLVQSIFTRKKVVCSGIAAFCSILLNHPLLGIKTKTITNDNVLKNHAWNNICINDVWYTCDFTWTIMHNDSDTLKYILIPARCKNALDINNSLKYSANEYNRQELNAALEKFKNVHINIPLLAMSNKDLIQKPTTINERRYIKPIIEEKTKVRRYIQPIVEEKPKVRRLGRRIS